MLEYPLWPMEMVSQVKRCWAETFVDNSVLALPDAESNISKTLFESFHYIVKGLVEQADLHEDDCYFTTTSTPDYYGMRIKIAWGPETNEIEFNGGPGDGMHFPVTKIGDPYKVIIENVNTYTKEDRPPGADIPTVIYKLDGWNPNTRRWIYRPQ